MTKNGVMGEHEEDIKSQLEEVQRALKESEEKYLSLYNNNHLIMMLIEPKSGIIIDANPAACNFYGYCKEEITSKTIFYFYTDGMEGLLGEGSFRSKFTSFDSIEQQKKFLDKLTLENHSVKDDLTWLAVEII